MLFLISCRARAIDTAKTSRDPTLDDETVEDAPIEAPAFRGISVEPDVFDVLSRTRNWVGILRITGAQCWRWMCRKVNRGEKSAAPPCSANKRSCRLPGSWARPASPQSKKKQFSLVWRRQPKAFFFQRVCAGSCRRYERNTTCLTICAPQDEGYLFPRHHFWEHVCQERCRSRRLMLVSSSS